MLKRIRTYLPLFFLFILSTALPAQGNGNPFELTDRLPAEAAEATAVDTQANPFDVYPEREEEAPIVVTRPDAPQVSGTDNQTRSIVFIHLLLVLLVTSLWVLFRDLLQQCVRAITNDNVMTQLYRRRSGGQISALWMCYLFFLLSAGFFLYLVSIEFGITLPVTGVWGRWLTFTLLVMGAVGFKLVLLTLLGRIYPLRKELSRYTFLLMVFSILVGILLVPINLLISYAPESFRHSFLVGGMVVLAIVYLLHLVRGLFIANYYVGSRPLHFLLYICTIEIAPLLLVYRYLSNALT
ncbi:uncharacterized protein DUF4271 [Neolewinella xylanilytica]|uniref:Uncharacterized protein DUF4271 n=1 Tax=Neolewinella xylanilytica TaxID=1514080 RepID=A0A2S6I731_9BACT|nr:DUF4271 domain-containing protein [Neolewinella xylanilytica]PPK87311.1 uncharacterized protein DUF4271 [Neolewinella xylanilytica]